MAIFPVLYNTSLSFTLYPIGLYHLLAHLIRPLAPSLSPLVPTSLFSVSVSLLLFITLTGLFYFLDSTYKRYTTFVFVWLISLSLIPLDPSMLLQVVRFHSFLWLSNIPLYRYTHLFYPFIYQWTLKLLPFLGYWK